MFPHRTRLFNIPSSWHFASEKMVSSLLLFISRAWEVLIFLVILRFSYRIKILPIVVPSYFNNKNTSFVIKFKPFPELTDILLLEQCETSGGYRQYWIRWRWIQVLSESRCMLWQQEWTQLPILNIDFSIENKTQTQQTKHSVTGIFFSNLGQSSSKSSFDAYGSAFATFWVRCITTLGRACWR